MSDKIKPHYLDRKATLYIRQSSTYQVSNNLESQKLQYAMQERLRQLGWRDIDIIDDDLGRSAAGTVMRAGFERMVAEVCLGQVGAVAAREVSRFARNSREWQRLVEVCRVVDTLLVDQEMIYTPRQSNDRLLLGLKGSLNEYELDLLRQRSGGGTAREGSTWRTDCGSSLSALSRPKINDWKRIRTDGFRRPCNSCSRSSWNWVRPARFWCGFWNTAWGFRLSTSEAKSIGHVRHTAPCIRF
jgi:DNA invertase Pin-like site-specific DNA recombinase